MCADIVFLFSQFVSSRPGSPVQSRDVNEAAVAPEEASNLVAALEDKANDM